MKFQSCFMDFCLDNSIFILQASPVYTVAFLAVKLNGDSVIADLERRPIFSIQATPI